MKRLVIIGSGPCGLGAAWRLTELGYRDFLVVERDRHVGGLASSFTDSNGFTWDIGGHVIHSHYPYFDAVVDHVMGDDLLTHQRVSWVFLARRFVPYPFQHNIHRLPPELRDRCLDGLKQAQKAQKKSARNFADWIRMTYGTGLADCFFLPYNRKVWAYPPEHMDFRWTGDRVALPDLAQIEESIKNGTDYRSWGPNATFKFPKRGGTGTIWQRVADGVGSDRFRFSAGLQGIDTGRKRILLSDGTSEPYDALLSTIPLDMLLGFAGIPVPRGVLHASAVTVVGLGVRGAPPAYLKGTSWMYFPEPDIPFFRATVMSNYSPLNAPRGTWSLMTEISSSGTVPLPVHGNAVDSVIGAARRSGLLREQDEIVDRFEFTTAYGYPTPSLGLAGFLQKTLPELETHAVYSRGRFGAWKYEVSNQDHTFMQGVEWADRMVSGAPERTVYRGVSAGS